MSEEKKTPAEDLPQEDLPNKEEKNEGSKMLTQEQFDKALTERLMRERKNLEIEMARKIKEEREDAEKMAALSAEEKTQELLRKKEEEISKKSQDLALRENRIIASEILSSKGIPTSMVEFVLTTDQQEMLERIEKLESNFNEAIANQVDQKLKGSTPKDVKTQNKGTAEVVTTF